MKQYFEWQYASQLGESEVRSSFAETDVTIEAGDTILVKSRKGIGTLAVVLNTIDEEDFKWKDSKETIFLDVLTPSSEHLMNYKKSVKNKHLKKKMDKLVKDMDEQVKYKMYADMNPEFKAIYDEMYGEDK